MPMSRAAFADIPWTTLFPLLSAADLESLKHAARAVDAARVDRGGADWEWALQHAAFPGMQPWTPIIRGMNVIERAARGDQLEFQLQVVWTELGRLAVDAAVNVSCWCDIDHATHDVDGLSLVVGEENSLPGAFQACAERLIGWLADPRDADYWRTRAGLIARQPQPFS
ncbi:hypothetical protein [Streptomyces sp. NPDC127092]|uniref:hypothetical protein n=1 Tax=Streptomyces sp. NPDC127092 TaxID=3347135 RepID=UPI003662BA15